MQLLEERERRKRHRKFFGLYPATGPLRRELYAKHMQFFAAGAEHAERAAIAANRVGKTWSIRAYKVTCHLTGLYPDWWVGKRFDHPISALAAGDTTQTTRDVVQLALAGVGGESGDGELGLGITPGEQIVGKPTAERGIAGAFDTMGVKHESGGNSVLGFKSYDQGRKKFQGTAKEVILLDGPAADDRARPTW